MTTEFKVLDHGYVRLIETWGSDERVIESARMSTGKGFVGWGPQICSCFYELYGKLPEAGTRIVGKPDCPKCKGEGSVPGDDKLLRYLWEHHHTTPFEMGGMTIEVQAPLFVFREWHRHRTQSYNEMSSRYTILPDLYYVPSTERMMNAKQGTKNKQGSQGGFTPLEADQFRIRIARAYESARKDYEAMLELGVAREIARVVLPVAQYSRMRASANLWNWLHFLGLRVAEGVQPEMRQYAMEVSRLVAQYFPRTHALFSAAL